MWCEISGAGISLALDGALTKGLCQLEGDGGGKEGELGFKKKFAKQFMLKLISLSVSQ